MPKKNLHVHIAFSVRIVKKKDFIADGTAVSKKTRRTMSVVTGRAVTLDRLNYPCLWAFEFNLKSTCVQTL